MVSEHRLREEKFKVVGDFEGIMWSSGKSNKEKIAMRTVGFEDTEDNIGRNTGSGYLRRSALQGSNLET